MFRLQMEMRRALKSYALWHPIGVSISIFMVEKTRPEGTGGK